LTVKSIDPSGQTKTYPVIQTIAFDNISNETGIPLSQIERTILKLVIQQLMDQLNIDQIFKGLQQIPGSPLKSLPNPFSIPSK
jgi:phosphoribosylaminoimidazole carboxylase (NCAIR synthetase)